MELEEKIGVKVKVLMEKCLCRHMIPKPVSISSTHPISLPCSITSSWDPNTGLHRSVMDVMLVHTARICYNPVTVLRDIIPASHCWEMSWKHTHFLISKFPSKGTLQILTFPINLNLSHTKTSCLFGILGFSFLWVSKSERHRDNLLNSQGQTILPD